MGFSSSLQGPSSHEALLARQDAEVRLLENMRRCLALRVKADREYAVALNSFVMQAQKAESAELSGSLVSRAWTTFIEESEKIAKHVKENAENLAANTLEKLNALYTEKKTNRKTYQEEYARISMELHRLQDSVNRTRGDYERCLEQHAACKAKYEEVFTKGKSGKRMDDVKERYQKSCRKLHLTHNDYVLLLCEASEFERDMRAILLPGLLEHQQAIQEDMIEKWKIILNETYKFCNPADQKGQDIQAKIEAGVSRVKSSEEYTKFIEQNKTTPPPPVAFTFDESLLEQYMPASSAAPNRLRPSTIVLDQLTMDTLKQKLAENETRLAECKNQIKDKQTTIIQLDTDLATVKFKSDPVSVAKTFSTKKEADRLKKEVNELRCTEQKLTRQNELIQAPLSELGCEQAPAGCDLSAESNTGLEFDADLSNKSRRTSGQVMSMLKKPFAGTTNTLHHFKSRSVQSLSQHSSRDSTPAPAGPVATSADLPPQSSGSSSLPSSVVDNGNNEAHLPSLEANMNNPRNVSSSTATTTGTTAYMSESRNNNPSPSGFVLEPGRPLEEELWFHGVLPRGEVVRLLETDGDYLVRETTRNDEKQIVLSVMWTSPKHFIVQTSPEGHFRFEGPAFPTVQELIYHQHRSGSPVTSRSGAILKRSINREKWELNNDDVELLEKIGRGNFGDVYRATLNHGNHPQVAVKTCKVTLPDEQKKKFLQEGRILKQYDHPNIVRFIGICVQKQPIMIVMELVPGGSLLNFLRTHGANLTQKNLLGMCLDAAAGMQYLESKNCIHRDLAARNCLVGDGNVVKISDFGMSREEEEYIVSDGLKQIPIKWTAPEALNYGKYTSLCDVWSYGVLSWEIFSRGGTPYQGMTNTRAREMLDQGFRMPAPEGIPEEMYQLMLRCWSYDPEERPHFPEIHAKVDLLFSRASVGPETRV